MFRSILATAAAALLLIVPSVPVGADSHEPSPANGIVMMVHATFEPWVNGAVPGAPFLPPALEAVAATNDDGRVVIHAITYTAEQTTAPMVVEAPVLRIVGADWQTEVAANGEPGDYQVCVEETNLPDHEGPIDACSVFDLPASLFAGRNVVHFELLFEDAEGRPAIEIYNVAAHYSIHATIESGGGYPVTLQEADEMLTFPTPFVVEHLVDPAA